MGLKIKRDLSKGTKGSTYYLHIAMGLAIAALFWFVLPAPAPITPVGMRVVGTFICMVYLWSTVEILLPSLIGLVLIAISGVGGDAGFAGVITGALGNETALLILFSMVLFGAVDACGATNYIAKFILTRKMVSGRPFAFLTLFFICCWVLGFLVTPMFVILLIWPMALRITDILGITKEDRLWKWFFVGTFVAAILGHPFLPFYDAPLISVATFQSMMAAMDLASAYPYSYPAHILTVLAVSIIGIAVLLLATKVLRVDVSKMKAISPEMVKESMDLPPISKVQITMLLMIPLYIIGVLAPSVVPDTAFGGFCSSIGALGVALLLCVISIFVRVGNKPMLNFREVSYTHFDWGIYFMIAVAIYTATSFTSEDTGVSDWLLEALNPVLGGLPEMAFVAVILTFALVVTSFANNAAMGIVLSPIVIQFSLQLGISPIPVMIGVVSVVFAAMLTPAASPHAGLLWSRTDIVTPKDIMSIGAPMSLVILVSYICIGYPLAKFLCGIF
jgi:solute carrier family 13 (sodium-dependent dicarboxylate transporter), member 2/3/5